MTFDAWVMHARCSLLTENSQGQDPSLSRSCLDTATSRTDCRWEQASTSQGFLHPEHPNADGIAAKADDALFSAICMNSSHVLSRFLPSPQQHQYHMRTRAHNFSLPPKDDRNFFYRETFRPIETYFSLGALVLSFLALATLFILFILSCQRCLECGVQMSFSDE